MPSLASGTDTQTPASFFLIWQNAEAFDQPLSFDTSGVNEMTNIFLVRKAAPHASYTSGIPTTIPLYLPSSHTVYEPSFPRLLGAPTLLESILMSGWLEPHNPL